MEEEQERKATPQLDAARFKLAEHERNIHMVTVEESVGKADITNPAFFAHVAPKCRPDDEIIVRRDDGAIFARLLVLQAERTWLRVHVLEWHDLTTKDVAQTQSVNAEQLAEVLAQFKVQHKGPHKKWCVIRQNDSAIVREGEESKANAQLWLDGYVKVIA